MKVIVAGSRTIHHSVPYFYKELEKLVKRFETDYGKITLIVSGMAAGPDKLGVKYAQDNKIHLAKFPANWDMHGRAAGPMRNIEMGDFADGAIIMWDGKSNGAKHMADYMRKLNKPFIIDIYEPIDYKFNHMPSGKITTGFHNPLKDL